jgi:hypothetical protein
LGLEPSGENLAGGGADDEVGFRGEPGGVGVDLDDAGAGSQIGWVRLQRVGKGSGNG